MANRFRVWGPAASWATVLFFLSAIPDVAHGAWLPVGDKVVHAALYAVLGGALAWGRSRSSKPMGHVWPLVIGLLYGLTDEWHQMYVPGRTPELADWIADAVGVVLGYGTTSVLLGRTNDDEVDTGDMTRDGL